jgi:1-phosphofructokinase
VILTLTPNPSIDRTLEISGLTPGAVHRATAEREEPSGKGVNVSRALTNNGVASLAILPVGGCTGAQLTALLLAEHISFEAIPISDSVRLNISLIESDGRATKINARGPEVAPAELDALTDAVVERVHECEWVVASGTLPRGVPSAYYATVGRRVHAAGGRFALDSSGSPFLAGLEAAPDLIKPNIEELEEAVGRTIDCLGEAMIAARDLLALGARSVLLSLGPDGALLISADEVVYAWASAVTARSTIGAGDALLAGFLAGGGYGQKALHEAVAWSTAAVGIAGSHVPVVTDEHRSLVHTSTHPDPMEPLHRNMSTR